MFRISLIGVMCLAFSAPAAYADATSYSPRPTGFTLPNAQQAMSAISVQTAGTANYATGSGTANYALAAGTATTANFATSAGTATNATFAASAGSSTYATNAGAATSANFATSAGSAANATFATSAASSSYATDAGTAASATVANSAAYATTAAQAAELTAGNNCPTGTALSVTNGILGCVSSVTSITGQLNGAQVVGDLTNIGNIYANGFVAARQSLYSDGAVYANGYAARDGTGTAAFYGNASTAGSAATVTGTINGAQIVGNLNVGSINASGNVVSNGYVYGIAGLFTDNAVFSNNYVSRQGGGNAIFNGTATSANSAGYATSAGSSAYAANTDVGILRQVGGIGDGSSFYCDAGYHIVFYDLNVFSTNNAFFYECIQDGH